MVNLMIQLNNEAFKSKNEAKAKLCINDFNEICKNLLMNENKHKQPNNTQRAQKMQTFCDISSNSICIWMSRCCTVHGHHEHKI